MNKSAADIECVSIISDDGPIGATIESRYVTVTVEDVMLKNNYLQ